MPMIPLAMAWDIMSFLTNLGNAFKKWGGALFIVIGITMIIIGVWKFFIGLANHGKTQVNWVIVFLLIVFGGALSVGGWNFVADIAAGGNDTIKSIGEGAAVMNMFLLK